MSQNWSNKLQLADILTRENTFVIGELFEAVWGRNNGIMHSICELPEPNRMFCTSEERAKGWTFTSESIFSPVCAKFCLF